MLRLATDRRPHAAGARADTGGRDAASGRESADPNVVPLRAVDRWQSQRALPGHDGDASPAGIAAAQYLAVESIPSLVLDTDCRFRPRRVEPRAGRCFAAPNTCCWKTYRRAVLLQVRQQREAIR